MFDAVMDETPLPSLFNYASTIEVFDVRDSSEWKEIQLSANTSIP